MNPKLKKGQFVAFLTNQPAAHLNEMFGYNDLGPDDFEKAEEIGVIKTVIDDCTYLVNTGGYLNNMYWANTTWRDAGMTAVLGYKFNEQWEGYVYGQKSIVTNVPIPPYLQDLNEMGDRIGAALRYNITPNISVQMSVETKSKNSLYRLQR